MSSLLECDHCYYHNVAELMISLEELDRFTIFDDAGDPTAQIQRTEDQLMSIVFDESLEILAYLEWLFYWFIDFWVALELLRVSHDLGLNRDCVNGLLPSFGVDCLVVIWQQEVFPHTLENLW